MSPYQDPDKWIFPLMTCMYFIYFYFYHDQTLIIAQWFKYKHLKLKWLHFVITWISSKWQYVLDISKVRTDSNYNWQKIKAYNNRSMGHGALMNIYEDLQSSWAVPNSPGITRVILGGIWNVFIMGPRLVSQLSLVSQSSMSTPFLWSDHRPSWPT